MKFTRKSTESDSTQTPDNITTGSIELAKKMSLTDIQAFRVDALSKKSSDTALMELARESALDVKGMTKEERVAFVGEGKEKELTSEKDAAVRVILDNFLYNHWLELGNKDSVVLDAKDVEKLIKDNPKTFIKLALLNVPADFQNTAVGLIGGLIAGGISGSVLQMPHLGPIASLGAPFGMGALSAYDKKKKVQNANSKFLDKYQSEINRIANSGTPEI
jgi:hypothetical protein